MSNDQKQKSSENPSNINKIFTSSFGSHKSSLSNALTHFTNNNSGVVKRGNNNSKISSQLSQQRVAVQQHSTISGNHVLSSNSSSRQSPTPTYNFKSSQGIKKQQQQIRQKSKQQLSLPVSPKQLIIFSQPPSSIAKQMTNQYQSNIHIAPFGVTHSQLRSSASSSAVNSNIKNFEENFDKDYIVAEQDEEEKITDTILQSKNGFLNQEINLLAIKQIQTANSHNTSDDESAIQLNVLNETGENSMSYLAQQSAIKQLPQSLASKIPKSLGCRGFTPQSDQKQLKNLVSDNAIRIIDNQINQQCQTETDLFCGKNIIQRALNFNDQSSRYSERNIRAIDSDDSDDKLLKYYVNSKVNQQNLQVVKPIKFTKPCFEEVCYLVHEKKLLRLKSIFDQDPAYFRSLLSMFENSSGSSILHIATEEKSLDVCQFILSIGASSNITSICSLQRTPLHIAAARHFIELFKLHFLNSPGCVNFPDAQGNTPLHLAASQRRYDIITFVIEEVSKDMKGKKLNLTKNRKGMTVQDLLRAAGRNNEKIDQMIYKLNQINENKQEKLELGERRIKKYEQQRKQPQRVRKIAIQQTSSNSIDKIFGQLLKQNLQQAATVQRPAGDQGLISPFDNQLRQSQYQTPSMSRNPSKPYINRPKQTKANKSIIKSQSIRQCPASSVSSTPRIVQNITCTNFNKKTHQITLCETQESCNSIISNQTLPHSRNYQGIRPSGTTPSARINLLHNKNRRLQLSNSPQSSSTRGKVLYYNNIRNLGSNYNTSRSHKSQNMIGFEQNIRTCNEIKLRINDKRQQRSFDQNLDHIEKRRKHHIELLKQNSKLQRISYVNKSSNVIKKQQSGSVRTNNKQGHRNISDDFRKNQHLSLHKRTSNASISSNKTNKTANIITSQNYDSLNSRLNNQINYATRKYSVGSMQDKKNIKNDQKQLSQSYEVNTIKKSYQSQQSRNNNKKLITKEISINKSHPTSRTCYEPRLDQNKKKNQYLNYQNIEDQKSERLNTQRSDDFFPSYQEQYNLQSYRPTVQNISNKIKNVDQQPQELCRQQYSPQQQQIFLVQNTSFKYKKSSSKFYSIPSQTEESDQQDIIGNENLLDRNAANQMIELELEEEEGHNEECKQQSCRKIGAQDFVAHKLLGSGAFGEVYLVEKLNTQEIFAMKVLKKKTLSNFLVKYAVTERNVLSSASHPFIVKLHYAFQTNQKLFLIMNYCSGGDMSEFLASHGPLSEIHSKIYISELLLAIEYLHSQNIIFRDLKPQNVVIDSSGHVLLTDFGLSKQGMKNSTLTKTFCGSPAYLAPEMIAQQGHGRAVDLYNLGAFFYEMVCGQPPFFAETRQQIQQMIQNKEIQFPEHVQLTHECKDLIKKLLQKNPNKRIGCRKEFNGIEQIKSHKWFQFINWDDVYMRKLQPPKPKQKFIPQSKAGENQNVATQSSEKQGEADQRFCGWSFVRDQKILNV